MDKAEYVARAPYWLIVREENGGAHALTFDFAGAIGGMEVLALFGSREEAEILLPGKPGSGWRVRESSKRELLSMLFGSYAAVKYVTLDPWPGPGMEKLVDLVGMGRGVFTDQLMGRGRSWFYARRNEEKQLSERSRGSSEAEATSSTVSGQRIQDREQLAHAGHQHHPLRLAGGEKPPIASSECRVADRRQALEAWNNSQGRQGEAQPPSSRSTSAPMPARPLTLSKTLRRDTPRNPSLPVDIYRRVALPRRTHPELPSFRPALADAGYAAGLAVARVTGRIPPEADAALTFPRFKVRLACREHKAAVYDRNRDKRPGTRGAHRCGVYRAVVGRLGTYGRATKGYFGKTTVAIRPTLTSFFMEGGGPNG